MLYTLQSRLFALPDYFYFIFKNIFWVAITHHQTRTFLLPILPTSLGRFKICLEASSVDKIIVIILVITKVDKEDKKLRPFWHPELIESWLLQKEHDCSP